MVRVMWRLRNGMYDSFCGTWEEVDTLVERLYRNKNVTSVRFWEE